MKRYLPLILTVVAALGAGITLVPSAWELASMKLRDKNFPAAEQAFERKYRDGDRSREVLLPLAALYVRRGRVDDAINVLTKYTQAHPGERDIVERLAALMNEAQQTSGAVAALESLAASNPEPKALRELDRQYDIAQDSVGRIGALMRLAQSQERP
jgi:DNA-binding SARP family transcriptional activator